MPDPITAFRTSLDLVPRVLLGAEDARVLDDAKTSAEILKSLSGRPMSVVLVGGSGVGKSYVLNALARVQASPEGVLRPTTRTIVVAGSSGPPVVNQAFEYVYASALPETLALIDTPAWGTAQALVDSTIEHAELAILVVSPSRYADASTRDAWDALEQVPRRLVILNRLSGTVAERSDLVASIKGMFGPAEIATVDEAGDVSHVRDFLESAVSEPSGDDARLAVVCAAAVQAARHLASAATAASIDLGQLESAVSDVDIPTADGSGLAVRESWLQTEQALVEMVRRLVNELDDHIVGAADGAMVGRVLADLGTWDSIELESALTRWRDRAGESFKSEASIRWRKSSTERLVDQSAWRLGVNPTVNVPKRVRRVLKSSLEPTTDLLHNELLTIIDNEVLDRLGSWQHAVTEAGSFQPGELLAAAEGLCRRE